MAFEVVRKTQFVGLVLSCWLCLVTVTQAGSPWQEEHLLPEPIFNGKVLLREAGRGNSEVLLLVHGLGHEASDIWEPFVPELATRFHVVAPDLPGFGRSTRANKLYSPDNHAQFIHWLVSRFPDRPIYLVGHSLGGAISLYTAARHGERFERLILIDSVGMLHRLAVSQHFVRDLIRIDLPFFSGAVESRLGRIAGLVLEKTARVPLDPDLVLATAASRERVLGGDPGQIAALALVQTDFSLILPQVRTPTWLIWGDQDQIAPIRIATILDWNLKTSRQTVLQGLGHTPMHDDPQRFLAALQQSLSVSMENSAIPLISSSTPVDAVCDQQHGRVFSGNLGHLQINGCTDVLISDAQVKKLSVVDSQVVIERTSLGHDAQEIAIQTLRSNVTLSGADIKGKVGIQVDQSRLDLAGVRFLETPVVVTATGNPSALLFSSSIKQLDGSLTPLQLSRSLRHGDSL